MCTAIYSLPFDRNLFDLRSNEAESDAMRIRGVDQPKRLLSTAPKKLIEMVQRVVDNSLMIEAGRRKIILRNLAARYPANVTG